MLVSVRAQFCSRSSPYPTRWRKARKNRQSPSSTTEEIRSSSHGKTLKLDLPDTLNTTPCSKQSIKIPAVNEPTRFGTFGGQFAPELQMGVLLDLPIIIHNVLSDDTFWTDFFACPLTRPSPLYLARNLTQAIGGANIWLKREDLNPFGSYLARTIVGQILFAHRVGKTEIVMDCGFAGHGLVCVTMCSRMEMKCTIFMGASDIAGQADAVERMRQLGANVISAESLSSDDGKGSRTGMLREATNEALRYSMARIDSAYHITSGTVGPHPLPSITRTFQSLLGTEIKNALAKLPGQPRKRDIEPAALIAHSGSSGSAALGMFGPFIQSTTTDLIAVEDADAAPLSNGSVGVMYGCKTLLLQDDNGQVLPSRPMKSAPDMSFPCAGPELASWKDSGRMRTLVVGEEDASKGVDLLLEYEGVRAGVATGYAVLEALRVARRAGPGRDVVLLVSE